MHLSLSDSEFERLLKLAYLGEVVMNDWTFPEQWTPEQREAAETLYDLCARAPGTLAEKYVERDGRGEWGPSTLLREEMGNLLGDYDDDVFWDELVLRLARRDLLEEYGQNTLDTMSPAHREKAEKPLIDYYNHEVRDHGLDRVTVDEDR
jgi:hypothetical protein